MHRDKTRRRPALSAPRGSGFHRRAPGAAIFHLKDFHEPLRESPEIRRRLRDVYESCLDQRKFVVITSPVRFIPEELERSIMFLELRPPDVVELVEFLRRRAAAAPRRRWRRARRLLEQFARALQGLRSTKRATRCAARLAASRRLGPESLPALLEEKRLLVNRSGVIEFIADGTSSARSAASKG